MVAMQEVVHNLGYMATRLHGIPLCCLAIQSPMHLTRAFSQGSTQYVDGADSVAAHVLAKAHLERSRSCIMRATSQSGIA